MGQSVIARAVRVAEGRFAPGRLGELTQQVPFEMVDAVLAETCRVQRRVRDVPARVAVCLVLAGCLFTGLGYARVWDRMVAGLGGLPVASPAAGARRQARLGRSSDESALLSRSYGYGDSRTRRCADVVRHARPG